MWLNKIKNGTYYIYYKKEDGKRTRISTRTKQKREALKFLVRFEKELANRKPSNTITLKELRKKYLMAIDTTHSIGSYRHSKSTLNHFMEFIGEDVYINEIGREKTEEFIFGIYKRAKHSASLHLRSLKAVFNRAIDWGYLEKNPFKGIRLRIPTNNPIFITKEELQLIVDKETNPTLKEVYTFAFYTGMRRAEILNLEWSDVDLSNRIIKVKNKEGFTTKSKRERVIPISDVIYNILITKEKNSTYVFNNNENKYDLTYVTKAFRKAVNETELDPKIHFHTLRHSFASALVQRGVDLYIVKQLLGHANLSTTEIYSHIKKENLVNAIEALN